MIVLDTNVLSEPLRAEPDGSVLAWLEALDGRDVAITSVSVGELLTGIARLPQGRRRSVLHESVEALLTRYGDAVLPYDGGAARAYAGLQEQRRSAGRPLSVEDGMIAAICVRAGATLATRNVRDFASLGLDLVDPWAGATEP